MKRKLYAIILVLLAVFVFSSSGCEILERIAKHNQKGLTAKEQEEVDKNVREWTRKITGVTWWDDNMYWSLRFYEDGSVEEDGVLSGPDNWYITFGDEFNENKPVSEFDRNYIEQFCHYFLHFDSPARVYEKKRYHCRISFDGDGNLVLWDTTYKPGVDYIHEVPKDAALDPFFCQCIWGDQSGDGKIGKLWIMQDDGLGAETVGAIGGEWILPETFYWSYKAPYLYIDWTSLNEDGTENHYKLDVFKVTFDGDRSFDTADYLGKPGTASTHWVEAPEDAVVLDGIR
ncbi:MAG: hypothetical protein IKX06_06875 [Clostridia bacterium]|nr:hypothetical protein [Clostridia bacterium]